MSLQFIPKNPYTQSTLNFTSRLQVQHKIQPRQLHAVHPDDHYCVALFKYFKSNAAKEKDHIMAFSSDDKSKIYVGESLREQEFQGVKMSMLPKGKCWPNVIRPKKHAGVC